jgi:hypothetical protein
MGWNGLGFALALKVSTSYFLFASARNAKRARAVTTS